jgi:hypothetical protein
MTNLGFIGACVFGLVLCGNTATAQDFGRYREFELGSAVAAVSMLTGVAESELKQIHQRPAVIQELTWRPRYGIRRSPGGDTDSVEQMVFDFYDGRLFRVTVLYDRKQTEGLTDADMIEAISMVYGSPARVMAPSGQRFAATRDDDLDTRIAEWGNESGSVWLHRRSTYAIGFRLVVTAEPVAALARTAAARAAVLDAREAPQREAARQKKEADDRRAAEEKARSTNKPIFRP